MYIVPVGNSNNLIYEMSSDPISPSVGQMWVLTNGNVGIAGQAMGVLGLTYSREEVKQYKCSIKTRNGDIKRTVFN